MEQRIRIRNHRLAGDRTRERARVPVSLHASSRERESRPQCKKTTGTGIQIHTSKRVCKHNIMAAEEEGYINVARFV